MANNDFSSLKLNPLLINNLSTLDYHLMTEIQAKSLPAIIDGFDVIAQAKTGSGKTAAFALGLLNKLDVKRFRIQSLVLCPTRELAAQVAEEIRKLARAIHNIKVLTLCGGTPMGPQIGSLEHGAHIIVGTPGRIVDHLERKRLNLDNVNLLVLDEADRMLDMGFQDALETIMSYCPKQRQTLLFSATFSDQIKTVANKFTNKAMMIKAESKHDNKIIKQHFYKLEDHKQRTKAVKTILTYFNPESAVIFCTTRIDTSTLAEELNEQGFSSQALHGDLEQREREITLLKFANGSIKILVATDVAARGLDIDSLDMVINHQLANDPEIHIHRIGRTGRAGGKGVACTLVAEKERHKLANIENILQLKVELEDLPILKKGEHINNRAEMVTLQIDGGKKQKIRPGDILGALTGGDGISGKEVGKINVFANRSFVAIQREQANTALKKLSQGKLKGRNVRARRIS